MEITLQDFFVDFRQDIMAGVEANNTSALREFVSVFGNELAEVGSVEDFNFCHYHLPQGGIRVDGYWFDEEEGILSLFIADYDSRDELASLSQTELDIIFKRIENFFEKSGKKRLCPKLEVTSDEYHLSRLIEKKLAAFVKVNLFLLSERALSERVKKLEVGSICGKPIYYHVWDISRLYRQNLSRGRKEPLELDFIEMFGQGIPCLRANFDTDSHESYLAVIPGQVLSKLYEKYDSRLLEQNVRTFLQARGNVNKGIRATILNEPSMFFAYNNGITATAQNVEVNDTKDGFVITHIRDLQIVNGGQTTASLFHAQRKDKASLEQIFVQMKLSVIDPQKSEEIVPKISEYANTQNRVNAADFFANSPFHLRMEGFSRRILAPARPDSPRETKWFYERARGQYAEAQSKFTDAEKRKFQALSPKKQLFTKEDLAKYENVWDEHPKHVSKGRQKNFAQYAARIGKEWETSKDTFNEQYYKRAVARAILFRKTEFIVSSQPWYRPGGSIRSYIVYYSLACLGELAKRHNKVIPFMTVWNQQEVPPVLQNAIAVCASFINDHVEQPVDSLPRDSEWFKKDSCWTTLTNDLSSLAANQEESFWKNLVSRDEENYQKREAAKVQNIDDGIAAQKRVVSIPPARWKQLLAELAARKLLSEKEIGILTVATQIPLKIPTDKQSVVLLEILEKAKNEGIVVAGME
ncbi:MAG: AIPR family protein [Desulfovibrio sp.]|jgi:hypothetical protein|nr:AIPR family protein [Desulfovibrio sp.]